MSYYQLERYHESKTWVKVKPHLTKLINLKEFEKRVMPRFYSKVLTTTLKEAVEESLDLRVEDQLNLFEELAIIRFMAGNSLQIYKNLEEDEELKKDPKKYSAQKFAAQSLVMQALESVGYFCEKAARVDSLQRDKYSIHTINNIVAQISGIIYDKLAENNHDLAIDVEKTIREQLVVPVQTVKLIEGVGTEVNIGTKLTPEIIDAEVLEMDDSVPGEIELT